MFTLVNMSFTERVNVLLSRIIELKQSTSRYEQIAVGLVILLVLSFFSSWRRSKKNIANVPIHGYRSRFEPAMLLQLRFVMGAKNIISTGYKKFKNVPFIVRRFDTDYNILPIKYLEELRWVSPSILSSKVATTQNMLYEWTDLHFLNRSDLHAHVMKAELTPKLSKYLELASNEVEYGWNLDIPPCDDWVEVDIQEIARKLVARMSARIFLGEPACRDPEWLRVSLDYTIDVFATAFMLRMAPTWMRFILARFIPFRYRLRRHRKKAEQVVADKMKRHLERKQRGEAPEGEEALSLLDWMLDNGTEEEKNVPEMAHRQCVMTMASIHTTSTNTVNFLFELCAHPEWFPVLREEIEEVAKQTGNESKVDIKRWHARLEKMDSFLLECFRIHPPILLSPQRVALRPFTLKDGTYIPQGCRIAFANSEHQMDPEVTPNPTTFDPMRAYRARHAPDGDYYRNQAVQTDINNNLTFGYGSQACPGRFLGVAEIKLLLARLLTEFDFKYPAVHGNESFQVPRTMTADENVFMDPRAKLMMRRRKVA
ncbi:Cytochrome P450 [Naviculisporaceae sp. PSN 640]